MPELSDEELDARLAEARNEGRLEREREWQDLQTIQRLNDLENRLDSLTTEVVATPPETAAEAEETAAEGSQETAEEVEKVEPPEEPAQEDAPQKHKPKFRIM